MTPASRRYGTASCPAAPPAATRLEPAALLAGLRDLLGARLVAYLGGVKETRAARQGADGPRQPAGSDRTRLRIAYQAAALIARDTPAVVQAWFTGLNPELGDTAPPPGCCADTTWTTPEPRCLPPPASLRPLGGPPVSSVLARTAAGPLACSDAAGRTVWRVGHSPD